MAGQDFRLRLDRRSIKDLESDPGVRALVTEAGEQVADYARLGAPKLTGEGARSIFVQPGHDAAGWFADIAWDMDHFYMIFAEFGTKARPETPFIRPAIDRYLSL